MPKACRRDPWASTTEATSPRTISEKYSAGPNCSANSESGGANTARSTVATQPAKKEQIAAVGCHRELRASSRAGWEREMKPPQRIGFAGLGLMGRPMATRLADAGYALEL